MNAALGPAAAPRVGRGLTVGLDIGGTKTLAIAVDDAGAIRGRVRIASGYGPEAVVAEAVAAVTRLRESLGGAEIAQVGIGIPGTVDAARGEVEQALNLGLEHLALAEAVAARLGLPVHVENDVNAAALGAFGSLAPRGPLADPAVESIAYLNLGTGLAAGLVLGGRLWRGANGAAGEIGHVPLDPRGPECVCGQRGCLEALASGSGIARQWGSDGEATGADAPSGEAPGADALWRLAVAGDARATRIVDGLVWAVASAVRVLVLAHDVERIMLGGGLAEALGTRLAERVLGTLRDWEGESPFLASLAPAARVVLAPAGVPLAALGAALAAESHPAPAVAA